MTFPDEAVEAAAAAIQVRTGRPLELEDLARAALDAAAPYMPPVHHHDIEAHAQSFNEGYATAMAQHQGVDMSEGIKAADVSHSHLGLRVTFAQEGFSITDRLRGVSHEVELSGGGEATTRSRTLFTFANAGRVLVDGNALILVEATDAS